MKTTIDFVNEITKIISGDAVINSFVSGNIFKTNFPDGLNEQMIVINSPTADNDQVQTALVNVNIHWPNNQISYKDQPVQYVADTTSINYIAKLIIDLIDDYYDNSILVTVQSAQLFEETSNRKSIYNIRLIINSSNV